MPWPAFLWTVFLTFASLATDLACGQSPAIGHRELAVMTRNLYVGTDLTPVIREPTPPSVEATFAKVQQTDFPARAKAIANEIAQTHPTLIGLQEVALFRSQTPGDFLGGHFSPNDELLDNEESLADARTDLIFARDGLKPGQAHRPDLDVLGVERTGDEPVEITDSVRWASDHFGVVATVRLRH